MKKQRECDFFSVSIIIVDLNREQPSSGNQGHEYFEYLRHITLDIEKSALLWRLLYREEKLRTEKCPTHKGELNMDLWLRHPDAVRCVCGGTGWLPNGKMEVK